MTGFDRFIKFRNDFNIHSTLGTTPNKYFKYNEKAKTQTVNMFSLVTSDPPTNPTRAGCPQNVVASYVKLTG